LDVKDEVAVVTGGASGMGLALCLRFVQESANVVLSAAAGQPPPSRKRSRAPVL